MKKKKLSFIDASSMLSKKQMKAITAGSGNCQAQDEACDTSKELNCCNKLQCADNTCKVPA